MPTKLQKRHVPPATSEPGVTPHPLGETLLGGTNKNFVKFTLKRYDVSQT